MTTTAKQWLESCKYDADIGYYEYEGTHYQTIEDIVHSHFFGFCGCGDPEGNLQYIRDGLDFIDWRFNVENTPFEKIKEKQLEIFGNEKAAYFFYYWCDKEDLTEHGGSVPGWLSEKGKLILDILKTLKFED